MEVKKLNWCLRFNREINDELVNINKPDCIQKANGCGNCDQSDLKTFVDGQEITVKSPTIDALLSAL